MHKTLIQLLISGIIRTDQLMGFKSALKIPVVVFFEIGSSFFEIGSSPIGEEEEKLYNLANHKNHPQDLIYLDFILSYFPLKRQLVLCPW